MNEQTKSTPGPWREGKTSDSIISDSGDGVGGRDRSSFDYYGGYVIAESVAPCNKPLIMAAPALLAVAKQAYETLAAWTDILRRYAVTDGQLEELELALENAIFAAEPDYEP